MSQSFPAGDSANSLKWAVALALLIDISILMVLLFSWKTESMILLTSILPIAVSGVIVYSSYAAGRMKYVLEEEGLNVSFPLSPLKISYSRIKAAGKVETNLRFRLFGGSLPGAHWGTFTTSNLGSAHIYSTRSKGEFVLLELSDGAKVLISPQEPEVFVSALREKITFAAPMLTEVEEPRLDRQLVAVQVAVVTIAWLALATYVTSIYPGLPEVIPVHFGLDGVPNRFGSKVEMLMLVVLSALFPTLNAVFVIKFGKYNKGLTVFLGVVFLFALGLFAIVVNQIVWASHG